MIAYTLYPPVYVCGLEAIHLIMASSGAVESMVPFMAGGEEKISSIMLSTSELTKLDLSNIQLFQANVDYTQNCLNDHEKEVDPFSLTRQDLFSIPMKAEERVSMASGLPVPLQVFKSRSVIDAEKFRMEQNRGKKSGRKKSESMDETHLNGFESRRAAETKKIKKPQDDSAVHDRLRRSPLPMNSSQAEEEQTEAGEITRINPCIDLKSSHASKFLMQVMPWELQPSPLTPFTPLAVPFKWEEVPGKPKTLHEANRLSPQINSFPVLHPPPRLLRPPSATKKLSMLQSQSVVQHSMSSSESCSTYENRVISVEMKTLEESPRSVISSLNYKLPSPWNGDVKPAYSPFRDLGPPEDAIHRLRTKATSTLTRIWRKTNPRKHKPKPNSAPPVSSCGRGKVLIDREALWVEVNESTQTNHSLNARIAVAMGGVDDEGFSNKTMMCLWEGKDLRPIQDSKYYRNELKLVEKRPWRKWLMRKLRRPAQFFRAFFKAVRRAVSLRKSRRRNRENIKLPYESLVG